MKKVLEVNGGECTAQSEAFNNLNFHLRAGGFEKVFVTCSEPSLSLILSQIPLFPMSK